MDVKHGGCKKDQMRILQWTERSIVRQMIGVHPKDIETSAYLMPMLGLNATIDQLAIKTVSFGMVMC